jgi:hypothetical protein
VSASGIIDDQAQKPHRDVRPLSDVFPDGRAEGARRAQRDEAVRKVEAGKSIRNSRR